ncbi:MAG: hypothetical protein QNJ22_11920 [Desulfosarcinaceae bacterium]|nr:hypothetical protein [Desulfosarcinaceae bacterium]
MAALPDLDQRESEYLKAMVEACQGEASAQVSMYDVGARIGLDRDTASQVCQELIGFGLVEIKTLSGGVGLTADGLTGGVGLAGGADAAAPRLKAGPILDAEDHQAVLTLLDQLKLAAGRWQLDYEAMAAFVVDIKTIETQLLAPQPKTAVVKAVCESLATWVRRNGDRGAAAKIDAFAGR